MNTRQRTLIRSRCRNRNFNGFGVTRYMMDNEMPGVKREVKRRYIKMLMSGQRRWAESIRQRGIVW